MLRSRLFRHILLDHDQPVAALVQRVGLHARFGSCTRAIAASKAAITSARCWGTGKGGDDDYSAHVKCLPPNGDAARSTPGLRRSCRQSRWLTGAASTCATLPPASTVSLEVLLLLPGLLAAARIRGSGRRVKAGKAIALRCPQGGLGAAARPGQWETSKMAMCVTGQAAVGATSIYVPVRVARLARAGLAKATPGAGTGPAAPQARLDLSYGHPRQRIYLRQYNYATYANYADGHLGPCAGRRRGERHGPLSAAHAEPGNMRTLAAVTDTPAQRAESAICRRAALRGAAPRITVRSRHTVEPPLAVSGNSLRPPPHQMPRLDIALHTDLVADTLRDVSVDRRRARATSGSDSPSPSPGES